ncbi:pseudouridine synthase [Sporodiniella umbellata]|nr:pseudouridine synthase [Sporodiniella umbellata]
MDKYKDYTREQLIERISELESKFDRQNDDSEELKHKKPKKQWKNRPFDMNKYTKRKIALRIAYIGWNYIGFASQQEPERIPTIEDQLFRALKECKLVADMDESVDYTRCGRTDRGVSGLGQVIALWVRSKKLTSDPSSELLPAEEEFPYVDTLNRMLPPDIRVLAWAPVPEDFSARFHCTSRTYKYFFSKGKMDIEKIRQGCKYFEGEHDFRNFCKMDPAKNILSYERRIVSMKVNPVEHTTSENVGDGSDFYEVELKGTAFLWHQVRFMMSVMFLVGQGLEPPETIRDLLDPTKVPSKPDFPMASDLPLVLYDCEFKDLEWFYAFKEAKYDPFPSSLRVYLHYNEMWNMQMIRSLTYQYYLTKVGSFPAVMSDKSSKTILDLTKERASNSEYGAAMIPLGAGRETRVNKYKPVLERPRCDSDQLKKEKYEVRKKRKLDAQQDA